MRKAGVNLPPRAISCRQIIWDATIARRSRLCSASSGVFLLAETGLFEGRDATVHFSYARVFSSLFPGVIVHPERVLVISGRQEELVSSGASNTWHDLVLYLIAHHVGATVAQDVARNFALQWHQDGLAPYIVFEGRSDHGDAEIAGAQSWLQKNFSVGSPVEEMIRHSRLAERTFKRRFAAATGLTSIAYVQRLRIEDAKRRLERTDDSVEEISWRVGYEDPAFFRRLFKRTTDTRNHCHDGTQLNHALTFKPDQSDQAAQCHSCTLLPETSCETGNRYLDRALIVGLPEEPEIGFFADKGAPGL